MSIFMSPDAQREIREIFQQTQADLPPEDRVGRGLTCREYYGGYVCTKERGHESSEHLAHNVLGHIVMRWQDA